MSLGNYATQPTKESAMSEVIYLDTSRFAGSLQSDSTLTTGPSVYVREAHAGIWLVQCDDDSKGGCFRNRRTAFQFVEDEFGSQAQIVVRPRFSAQARQRAIAQRAVAAQ
jgi:hypothetical protein